MRSIAPATIYVVSPGGQVVRQFTVKQDDENFRPFTLQIAGNRIAILYFQPQTPNMFIKILDLEGREVTTYKPMMENGKEYNPLGLGLACYALDPERFTFISTNEKNRLVLKVVEPAK